MSTCAEVQTVETRWRDAVMVVVGTLAAFALGVLARVWMRLISDVPEFSWAGTLGIVIGFTIFGLSESLVALARRRRWRPWPARVVRCGGIIGMLPLFLGAGGLMMPTVVFGGLAAWRNDWPKIARIACVSVALLPVFVVGSGVVGDFGWSLHSLAGMIGLLGVYGAIVWATHPTMTRPINGWRLARVAVVVGTLIGAVIVIKLVEHVV